MFEEYATLDSINHRQTIFYHCLHPRLTRNAKYANKIQEKKNDREKKFT